MRCDAMQREEVDFVVLCCIAPCERKEGLQSFLFSFPDRVKTGEGRIRDRYVFTNEALSFENSLAIMFSLN